MAFVISISILLVSAALANLSYAIFGYPRYSIRERIRDTIGRNIISIGSTASAIYFMFSVNCGFRWDHWCGWLFGLSMVAGVIIAILICIVTEKEECSSGYPDELRDDNSISASILVLAINMIVLAVTSWVAAYIK